MTWSKNNRFSFSAWKECIDYMYTAESKVIQNKENLQAL